MQINRYLKGVLYVCGLSLLLIANSLVLDVLLKSGMPDSNGALEDHCKTGNSSSFFGFDAADYHIQFSKFKSGESIGSLLNKHNIPFEQAQKTISNIANVFPVTRFNTSNSFAFISANLCTSPDYFCYEINPTQYLVCQLKGDQCVNLVEKDKKYVREFAYGYIETSLWNALTEDKLSLNLIDQMEDALASSVDFLNVQKGNAYKLVFERLYIDGEPTDDGVLLAAYFDTGDRDHYSFRYKVNSTVGYYDLNGAAMKSKFLKAPLRFSRITSGFTNKRFHPVLKRHKAHLGTDYAAPHGTPIMAVGNGVVEAASYTSGNGNYVKIRHDKTYQTQYLHMSRFAKGIRRGASVNQGQVIGYVGSTGLATGPHVCFRFWKNGRQVNHRRLHFPSPEPLPKNLIADYHNYKKELLDILDSRQLQSASYHRQKS